MELAYRIAADVTVLCHMGYALFIVLGQVAIIAGAFFRWQWIRNWRFRIVHLAAILIVVCETLAGMTCPLTTLEKWLRIQAGQTTYRGDFLANFIHDALFVEISSEALTVLYAAFATCVLVCLRLVPPGAMGTSGPAVLQNAHDASLSSTASPPQ